MSFPAITEIVQSDLFTSETELREKFPQTSVDRLLRIRAMYNWLISNPETKDKEFVDETLSRYNIHKSVAYICKSSKRCCLISRKHRGIITAGSTMR